MACPTSYQAPSEVRQPHGDDQQRAKRSVANRQPATVLLWDERDVASLFDRLPEHRLAAGCAFVLGDPRSIGWRWCSASIDQPGAPYCAVHAALVRQSDSNEKSTHFAPISGYCGTNATGMKVRVLFHEMLIS
jgi:hypothetical protein